jgi:virulence factor Mce-like protein
MFGRPVGKQRSRFFMVTVGLAGLLLAAATFYVGYQAAYSVPGRGYYNVHAQFANAQNLANHYEIRMGGVRVGQVLNPRVQDGAAVVDMRLDDKYRPLRSDSKLRIRLRSAVGVRYLEIVPGKSGAPLRDGATIPASQTSTPVALDEVLGTFDRATRTRTRVLLNELGAGTSGRGPDVNEALATAPRFLAQLSSVSTAITDRGPAMSRLISAGDGAANAFDPVRGDIAAGFDPERRALAPFSDRRGDLQATLAAAPPALGELRGGLPAVSRLADAVGGFARAGQPTLAEAPAALRSTVALLRDAKAPLGDARDTLDLAQRAVPPTLDLLGRVRPVLPSLDRALSDVVPTLDYLAPRACELSSFSTGWAEYLKWGDSQNNFIRFILQAARPSQPGGQTHNVTRIPQAGGGDAYDRFIHSSPYPPPCNGNVGSTGFERPTEAESIRGETYSAGNPPGGH